MKKQFVALCIMAVTLSTQAVAGYGLLNFEEKAGHFYTGLSYAFPSVDVDADGLGSDSFNNEMLGLTIGYQFNTNFAAEVRGYTNVNDDEVFGNIPIEVKEHYSLLGRAILPVDRYLKPYALLGYGSSQVKAAGSKERESDVVYGAGLSINNGERVELEIEWLRIADDSFGFPGGDVTADTININLVYHFPRYPK